MLPPGHIVDRYVVEALLGGGGMAAVYRVRHRTLRTVHALKVLTTTAPQVRERLVVEGQIQAGLRHPNLVGVTDVLDVDDAPALLMEFVDGPALDAWIEQRGPLPLAEVEAIFRGILAGVGAAHARGLVHRDLKPANVLLDVSGPVPVPRVADFGIAKVLEDDATPMGRTRTGIMMGTPRYMSPEQYDDAKGVDARGDVFALGCILYEMLVGRPAFEHPTMFATYSAIHGRQWARVEAERADVPPAWCAAIAGCLEPERDARIGSCGELLEVLAGARGGLGGAGMDVGAAVAVEAPAVASRPAPTILAPVRGAGVGSGAGVAAAVTPAVAPVSPLVAPVPTDEARPAYPGTAPVPRSAPDRLDELADLRPAAPMGPVAPDAHRIALDAPPAPTDPGPFPVDTSSEANFWRSVARALPVRVKTPTQVAEFINKAPRAKDRAPNGRHWTGKDVTERWVGMPAAYGGAVGTSGLAPGPTSATKPTTTRTAATPAPRPPSAPGNGGALLAGVGSLLGLLVCAGAGATWLFGGGEDTVLPAAPPATTPVEPASPSPAAPAPAAPEPKATPKPKPAAPALDAKPKVAPGKTPAPVPATPASPGKQPRDTTPAGQGGDAPIRTVPGPAAPASPGSPRSKTVLTDNDEIFAMAKAVINMSSVQLQACYDQRIKEVEDLKGAWSAAFTIAKDGTTKSVAVEGVNLSDAPLEACMTAAIADWRFERIAKEQPVKKTYRFGAGAW